MSHPPLEPWPSSPKILVVTSHYLPGFQAGGPIRTLSNLVEQLGDEFQFHIVTNDRDLGDRQPYADITYDKWHRVGKAKVRYLPPRQRTLRSWRILLRTLDYDILYLNSYFATATRLILFLRWCNLVPKKPTVMAPRGEFSEGALELKKLKKQAYLRITKFICMYDNILWQASSHYEKQEIMTVFNSQLGTKSVIIAPNLPSCSLPFSARRTVKQPHSARIIFLSRIARKKNLAFALNLLSHVNGDIEFDIYGPIEDKSYWQECQARIHRLPDNINVTYKGVVHPEQVSNIFRQYHLFLFPTRGENFGHVIWEALHAGCLVLTSDKTPWHKLTKIGAGWDISLTDTNGFHKSLADLLAMDHSTFLRWSQAAQEYAQQFTHQPSLVEANRQLFLKALAL